MKTRTKYAIGYVEQLATQVAGEVKAVEPEVHLYAVDGDQILVFENRTKCQGALDMLNSLFPNKLPASCAVIKVEVFEA